MPRIAFLCHASKDQKVVKRALVTLETAGIPCWFAPRDIKPGAKWPEAIASAIEDCRCLVLFVTEHANRSEDVSREISQAARHKKPILPVQFERVEPVADLDYFIRAVHWINASTVADDDWLHELRRALLPYRDLLASREHVSTEKLGKIALATSTSADRDPPTDEPAAVEKGMRLDRGFMSPHFINEPTTMTCVLEKPLILVADASVSSVQELVPLLETVRASARPLLIIAEHVESEALATLVVSQLRGIVPCCAVKAPGFASRRTAMLEDVAVVTGTRVVASVRGTGLDSLVVRDLGSAERAVIDANKTTIWSGAGSRKAVLARIARLREEMKIAASDDEKEKLSDRISRLAHSID